MNVFRRLSTARLLALCAAVLVLGLALVTVAGAVGGDPRPPAAKPLAQAIHDAAAAPPVAGLTARVELTNNLVDANGFEGISPLVSGGEGRLWWSRDGRFRLELQGSSGDVQVVVRDHEFWAYDAASNRAWRGELPEERAKSEQRAERDHRVPTVAAIERKLRKADGRAAISEPDPRVEAGQPAYAVRATPERDGGLLGGVALAWDAVRGTPLRIAVHARGRSAPVLELKATEVEYGPVDAGAFAVDPPPGADITELTGGHGETAGPRASAAAANLPRTLAGRELTRTRGGAAVYGRGLDAIWVMARPYEPPAAQATRGDRLGHGSDEQVTLPTVDIDGARGRVLATPLGSAIEWTRDGVTYVVAGSVERSVAEAAARELE